MRFLVSTPVTHNVILDVVQDKAALTGTVAEKDQSLKEKDELILKLRKELSDSNKKLEFQVREEEAC